MKKFLFPFLFVALIATLSSFTCEELTGQWVSNDIDMPTSSPQEVMKMKCDYTFTAPDRLKVRYIMSFDIAYERKLKFAAYYEILAEGQYSCSPDSVSIIIDSSTIEVKISEDDVRISGIGLEDGLDQRQMQQQMVHSIKQSTRLLQMGESTTDVLTDIEISGKKMKCVLNGEPIEFKRKK